MLTGGGGRAVAGWEECGVKAWGLGLKDLRSRRPRRSGLAAGAGVGGRGGGARVYVHCRAGYQRSATVVAAVVTLRENLAPWKALETLRDRKPTANPLAHQRENLFDWWDTREQ